MRTQVIRHLYSQYWGSFPWILLSNYMSQRRIITHFAWIAHRLVSSYKPIRYTSRSSCRTPMAIPWNLMSDLKSWAISETKPLEGTLQIRIFVIFWYLWISLTSTVPGLSWHARWLQYQACTCLCVRAISALTWPCFGWLISSILSALLMLTATGLPITSIGPP